MSNASSKASDFPRFKFYQPADL